MEASRTRVALLTALSMAAWSQVAAADGGLIIHESVSYEELDGGTQTDAALSGLVSSSGQRAVIRQLGDGCFELTIDPGEILVSSVVWLVPLPAVPESVEGADVAFIDQLDVATQPLLTTHETRVIERYSVSYESDGGGDSFGCVRTGDLAVPNETYVGSDTEEEGQTSAGVETSMRSWASGRLGAVDYDVVTAESAEELEAWLTERGFVVPESFALWVQPYLDEDAAFFAARVAREVDDETGVPAFRFRFCDVLRPSYPIRLSRLSVAESLAFTLWIVHPAGQPAWVPEDGTLTGFGPFFESYDLWEYSSEPEIPDFEQLYLERRQVIHGLYQGRGMALEYSGGLSDQSIDQRVEALGRLSGDVLDGGRSSWTPELREIVDGGLLVDRMSADFPLSEMHDDVVFTEEWLDVEPGVYSREVTHYEEEWVDAAPEASPEAEDPDPLFDDASCRVLRRPRPDLPSLSLLLVALTLLGRRIGRRRGRR